MHDQLAMGVIDHARDLGEQRQACLQSEGPRAGVLRQRVAADEVHRQVRATVRGDAGIQQRGNRRMVELGEDAAFLQEALQQRLRVHAALEQLDRRGLHHIALLSFGQPDFAHAATTEQALDPPARAELGVRLGRDRRQHFFALFEHALGACIGDQ